MAKGQLEADFLSSNDVPCIHFQLCANMHTRRLNIKSSRDARITLALDAVTFDPSTSAKQVAKEPADFIICELEIMLEDDASETRRLAEIVLDEEVKRLHLDGFPKGRSKLFTYLQKHSPAQYEIWLQRHNDQELGPLLTKAKHGWQHTRLQSSECTCEWSHAGGFKQCQACTNTAKNQDLKQPQVSVNVATLKKSKRKTDVQRLQKMLHAPCPWISKRNLQAWQQLQRNAEFMLR